MTNIPDMLRLCNMGIKMPRFNCTRRPSSLRGEKRPAPRPFIGSHPLRENDRPRDVRLFAPKTATASEFGFVGPIKSDAARGKLASNSRRSFLLASLAAFSGMIVGCDQSDWRNIPRPPFRLGGDVGSGPSSSPRIEILRPATGRPLVLRPRERTECALRLTYPGRGRLPCVLRAVFRDAKGAEAGSFALEPQQAAANSFTIAGRIKAPVRPGRYRLDIDIVSASEPSAKGDTRPPGGAPVTTVEVASVEISRR